MNFIVTVSGLWLKREVKSSVTFMYDKVKLCIFIFGFIILLTHYCFNIIIK